MNMETSLMANLEMARFDLDPVWSRLADPDRERASAWSAVFRRMRLATDKGAELQLCRRDFAGVLGSMSTGTVYRHLAAIGELGLGGAVTAHALRRAAGVSYAETALPAGFIAWWQGLCGLHQRRKVRAVWRHLMREWLIAGKTIPGYDMDWRGIWLAEHPGGVVPERCPYTDIAAGPVAHAPHGWSYSSLKRLAPQKDAWAGTTVGVQAMQAFNPSIPHTRVGLRPMQVVTMDDVTLDAFCWHPGERAPRRPVGLGVLDILTGNMVSWSLVPVRERTDGTQAKLDGLTRRYADAAVFCAIGIDLLEGVTMLLEHGTAGMDPTEEERINKILGAMTDGRPWLKVLRSSTSGAPLMQGLFRERGRGRPTHKAMLESAWNLLHNELAMLPGPAGRNWDQAPQDQAGWAREDVALIRAGAELLAQACPEAIEALARARTHALPYAELSEAARRVIREMNHRRGHDLEGWDACGFVRPMVDVGGVMADLDAAAKSLGNGDPAREEAARALLAPGQRPMRMSPAEAYASYGGRNLRRWDAFAATRILGPELAQRVRVSPRRQFEARNAFSGEAMLFGAVCRTAEGMQAFLEPGREYDVWVNPFQADAALVCETDGRWVGGAPCMRATVHGDREDAANVAVLGVFRGEQRRRMEAAAGAKLARETARRAGNARALAETVSSKQWAVSSGEAVDVAAEMAAAYQEVGEQV
jgi:hypothetical protein